MLHVYVDCLQPYVDTKAGELDTWPAHATDNATSSMSVVLAKNKHLLVLNDEDQGKAQIIPKPRFLDQLENFLKKELRSLGVTDVAPNELRLQVKFTKYEISISIST